MLTMEKRDDKINKGIERYEKFYVNKNGQSSLKS